MKSVSLKNNLSRTSRKIVLRRIHGCIVSVPVNQKIYALLEDLHKVDIGVNWIKKKIFRPWSTYYLSADGTYNRREV